MLTLTLQLNGKPIEKHKFKNKKQVAIGRRPDNDLAIDNLSVSGQHAKIELLKGGYFVTDLDSTNGTMVNGRRIESQWLNDGDVITIGKYDLIFFEQEDTISKKILQGTDRTVILDTGSFQAMAACETGAHPSPMNQNQNGALSFLSGGKGQIILNKNFIKIGKDSQSDVLVRGVFVGKLAATISKRPNGYYLCSADGKSKTKVNKKKIKGAVLLQDKDVIKIGSSKLEFNF